MGRPLKFSAEVMAAAVEASRGGDKLDAVAFRFRVSLSTLKRWRARAGVPSALGRPRKYDYETIFRRWNEGDESKRAIARAYGTSANAIGYALKHARPA